MKNSDIYYQLPKVRAARGHIRRSIRELISAGRHDGYRCKLVFRDDKGVNPFKSRRWRGRVINDEVLLRELVSRRKEQKR